VRQWDLLIRDPIIDLHREQVSFDGSAPIVGVLSVLSLRTHGLVALISSLYILNGFILLFLAFVVSISFLAL
jgi:hypothetical protein